MTNRPASTLQKRETRGRRTMIIIKIHSLYVSTYSWCPVFPFQLSAEDERAIREPILEKYEREGHPYYSSARSVFLVGNSPFITLHSLSVASTAVGCKHGSHMYSKTSNVLEYNYAVRVPSNVLEWYPMFSMFSKTKIMKKSILFVIFVSVW